MQYRNDKNGEPVSLLGFGCMRFTKKAGMVDRDKAQREILAAVEAGVNYFDTAYIYGDSESALGEIFERTGIRDRIKIATKLPQYLCKSVSSADKYFETQLKRLRTDHIDYYLMHMLNDAERWQHLEELGFRDWIREKKASGQIRNIGFSYHGSTENFKPLLDAYDWDFCMIQYNYVDEHSQAGRSGLEYAHAKGLPVIIMEPLRGGKLVNGLPPAARAAFDDSGRGRSYAEWGLRWLWQQPEITCVLSGMNSEEMLRENLRIADEVREWEFTDEDNAVIRKVRDAIAGEMQIPCTGCGYCMPCPHGVDIPLSFSSYNKISLGGKRSALWEYIQCTLCRKTPTSASRCTGCGLCERHCPQQIPIRSELKKVTSEFEGIKYKTAGFFIRKLKLWS